jgi:predicted AlkP superfamily pyrophosphatase or phosphodiesterase
MNYYRRLTLFCIGAFNTAAALTAAAESPQSPSPAEPPRLAVVISIDQFRADYLDRFRPHFVAGGFRRLLEQGTVYADAHHRHAMTATAPGHSTILTGVHANIHGIIANEWFDLSAGRQVSSIEDPTSPLVGAPPQTVRLPGGALGTDFTASPRHLLAATVGDQLKLRYGAQTRVIALANKDRGGIFLAGRMADAVYWFHQGRIVTSRYYREALPEWVAQFNADEPINRRFGQTWDRLLDVSLYNAIQGPDLAVGEESRHGLGTTFPRKIDGGQPTLGNEFHNAYRLDPHNSEVLGKLAQRAITAEKLGHDSVPDLLCLAFSQLDYCGHSFGPDSHEIMDSVLRLDRALADLFTFLDSEIGAGRYIVALTADHGVAPLPERVAALKGNTAAGRIDYPTLNRDVEAALTARFGAPAGGATWTVRDSYGYRLIPATLTARSVSSSDAQQVVKAVLQNSPQVAFAFTRDELVDVASPHNNYLAAWRLSWHAARSQDVVFSPKPYIVDRSPAGTNHGTPYDYDTHVPLLWFGPGIPARVDAARVGTDTLAPTLSALLDIPPPPEAHAPRLF